MNSENNEARPAAGLETKMQSGLDMETTKNGIHGSQLHYTRSSGKNPFVINLTTGRNHLLDQGDIDTLKTRMPEVLAYYGIDDPTRSFSSPWRKDANPSAHYYPDDNTVHDFGDGVTVDVFGLVDKMEHIDCFPDQVRRVAEIVGYDLNSGLAMPTERKLVAPKPKFPVPQVAGFGVRPLMDYLGPMCTLLESEIGLAYIRSRGFDENKVKGSVLGYVDDPKAVSPDFTLYEPNEVNGYIVIPFPMDETYCTMYYAMVRAIPVEGGKPPKHKEIRPTGYRSPLYKEHLVTDGCKVLFVTEGLLDCMSLETLIRMPCIGLGGIGGAGRLASLLYYAKPEQRPETVVLALDADEAGQKTANKLMADIESMGIKCSIMPMPAGCKDPNDILMMKRGVLHG